MYYWNQWKSFDIDLNWHTITASFQVLSGAVNLTWEWTVNTNIDRLFEVYWSDWSTTSTVSIWKNIIVNGDYWVLVFWNWYPDSNNRTSGAGVTVNIDWKLNVSGFWISVNGYIKKNSDFPLINIWDSAKIISSESQWIYQAWYSKLVVSDWAEIIWKTSAVESRAWELLINWWTFESTANFFFPLIFEL